MEIARKIFVKTFFFFFGVSLKNSCDFGEHLRLCPWSLALASRVSVLGKAVLGLVFFCVLGLGLEPCVLDSTSVKIFKANATSQKIQLLRFLFLKN